MNFFLFVSVKYKITVAELNIPKTTIQPSPNYYEPVKPTRKKPHKAVHVKEKHQGSGKKKSYNHSHGENHSGEEGEDSGAGTTLDTRTEQSPFFPSRPPPWILHQDDEARSFVSRVSSNTSFIILTVTSVLYWTI